jgi:hypothetical protein
MCRSIAKGFFAVPMTAVFLGSAFGSPLSSRLLPLVPPGAEIVAGFENHAGPTANGRLLLTTHNNRLDLDDWQALAGVDTQRVFDEFIEVAAAPMRGELTEHLLLVAGRFDRDRIFQSAQLNGAQTTRFREETVLIVKPFAREQGDMLDTRWLAILNNRIAILGTPPLVDQALRRYANHSLPDAVLQERLSLLRSDVTSWNVVTQPPDFSKRIMFARSYTAWALVQENTDVLMVGARFGSKIRVDFSIHTRTEQGEEFFRQKAAFFTNAFETAPSQPVAPPRESRHRLHNYSLEANRVQGSIELSNTQFEDWCLQLGRIRSPLPSPRPATRGD